MFASIYRELRGKYARHLREDFCGTFLVSCEWVKRNRSNRATAIDLSREPLDYGRRIHLPTLSSNQRKRIKVLRGDVLTTKTDPADLIVAGNFSFFIFHQRK